MSRSLGRLRLQPDTVTTGCGAFPAIERSHTPLRALGVPHGEAPARHCVRHLRIGDASYRQATRAKERDQCRREHERVTRAAARRPAGCLTTSRRLG